MSKPLEGVRVLEICNIMAGPFAGMLLADMGADVIKVEAIKGDMARAFPPLVNGESVSFSSLNRNKRSLAIDIKDPKGFAVVWDLALKADVLLENNRPGAMQKLGLGAEELKKHNPKLVYVSVSGFGQTGPDRRRGGINVIAEAASGVMSIYGEPDKMPMRPAIQTADLFAGMFAAYAALAGLVGGMAIASRGARRKVLGVPVPGTRRPLVKIKTPRRNSVAKDVAKAAGQMGSAGRQMAELATEVRLARQQLDNGRRRSPVEVVLEGLTSRRPR